MVGIDLASHTLHGVFAYTLQSAYDGLPAYGDGVRALVCGSRGLLVVWDGLRWQAVATSTQADLLAVSGGNNQFVAVGAGGVILYVWPDVLWLWAVAVAVAVCVCVLHVCVACVCGCMLCHARKLTIPCSPAGRVHFVAVLQHGTAGGGTGQGCGRKCTTAPASAPALRRGCRVAG